MHSIVHTRFKIKDQEGRRFEAAGSKQKKIKLKSYNDSSLLPKITSINMNSELQLEFHLQKVHTNVSKCILFDKKQDTKLN